MKMSEIAIYTKLKSIGEVAPGLPDLRPLSGILPSAGLGLLTVAVIGRSWPSRFLRSRRSWFFTPAAKA